MNTFNRIIIVLDILLTMAIVTLVLALPIPTLTIIATFTGQAVQALNRLRPEYVVLFQALLIVTAIVIDALLVILIVAEFRAPRRQWIQVASVTGGMVRVATDSIATQLCYHIDPLPDVITVKPRVNRKGKGVAIALEAQVSTDVNVPRKADEVLEITRQVIEDKMGLQLAEKPQILIRMVTPPGGAPPRATIPTSTPKPLPAPSEPPAAPENNLPAS